MLTSYKIRQSINRKGNCCDNAIEDSSFKTLKIKMSYGSTLISKQQMKTKLFEFIEIWYNRKILPPTPQSRKPIMLGLRHRSQVKNWDQTYLLKKNLLI